MNAPHYSVTDLMAKIKEICPNAERDYDNNGQIIIYTGICQTENGGIREMTDNDMNSSDPDDTDFQAHFDLTRD